MRREGGEEQVPAILQGKAPKPFILAELLEKSRPITFRLSSGGQANGYNAELLPAVCDIYLEAREANVLPNNQQHVAKQAEILVHGLARVGIIALVDEATGYQQIREERALATILEKFIAKELQPWTKTFPYSFYEEIFRLKGWPGPDGVKRPSIIGHYTNDIVYKRLAPGVLDELRERNPTLPSGRRGTHHHRWFNPEYGHPKLREHLAAVTALMRASPNWSIFQRHLARAFPLPDKPISFPVPDDDG